MKKAIEQIFYMITIWFLLRLNRRKAGEMLSDWGLGILRREGASDKYSLSQKKMEDLIKKMNND